MIQNQSNHECRERMQRSNNQKHEQDVLLHKMNQAKKVQEKHFPSYDTPNDNLNWVTEMFDITEKKVNKTDLLLLKTLRSNIFSWYFEFLCESSAFTWPKGSLFLVTCMVFGSHFPLNKSRDTRGHQSSINFFYFPAQF